MKLTFVKTPALNEVPFAFFHPGHQKIYVSPALFKLCSSTEELKSLREHLKVRILRKINNAYPFDTIEDWIQYLKDTGEL